MTFLHLTPLLVWTLCCLASAQTSPTPKAGGSSGIEGVVSLGPTQGGPTRQGVPDTKPLANASFTVKQEDRTVAEFKTDDQGGFRVALPPGHYVVSIQDRKNRLGSYGPFEVEVEAGKFAKVHWECDTGMR